MRTEPDALLSLQRYFGQVLEEPWNVRTSLDVGPEPERPYVVISRNALLSSGAPSSLLVTLPVTVHCYPAVEESMAAAEAAELELRNLLWEAVEYGHPGTDARHRRLPLWNYDEETVPAGQEAPFRAHCDYLRVAADPSINTVREDADPRVMTVAVDLRCTFRRGEPVPSGQGIFRGARASATSGPEG